MQIQSLGQEDPLARLWRTIRLTGETINVDRALKVLTRRLCQDTPNVCLMLETVSVSGCS